MNTRIAVICHFPGGEERGRQEPHFRASDGVADINRLLHIFPPLSPSPVENDARTDFHFPIESSSGRNGSRGLTIS